jgi:hypothetical protein
MKAFFLFAKDFIQHTLCVIKKKWNEFNLHTLCNQIRCLFMNGEQSQKVLNYKNKLPHFCHLKMLLVFIDCDKGEL